MNLRLMGCRRVGAELRHQGIAVNSKKIRRLMRWFVVTTDRAHNGPIFPDLARDRIVDCPNQLWVADITYIAIATGFVYLAAILDAWSATRLAARSMRGLPLPRRNSYPSNTNPHIE
jgi:putative transposase